jgi:hypothetical protein
MTGSNRSQASKFPLLRQHDVQKYEEMRGGDAEPLCHGGLAQSSQAEQHSLRNRPACGPCWTLALILSSLSSLWSRGLRFFLPNA